MAVMVRAGKRNEEARSPLVEIVVIGVAQSAVESGEEIFDRVENARKLVEALESVADDEFMVTVLEFLAHYDY